MRIGALLHTYDYFLPTLGRTDMPGSVRLPRLPPD